MNEPIYKGILQSDLDCAHFNLLNFSGVGGSGSVPNTFTSTDIGLVGDGVTDNTTALQTFFTSLETTLVNTTLIVEDGVYIFNGPLQDTSARNAQILLPNPAYSPNAGFTLTIKGRNAIPIWADDVVPSPYPRIPIGARFKSTLATGGGTQPSFIGGHGTVANQNAIHLCIENMIFQTVANPLISCLNLEVITWVDMTRDVMILAGDKLDNPSITQPTHTDSCGLILPHTNIGVLHTVGNIHVFGFYTGVRFGEIAHVNNLIAYACNNGIELQAAFHPNLIEKVLIFHCVNGITVTRGTDLTVPAISPVTIIHFNIEHENPVGPWYTTVYDINDPNNWAFGDINWWVVKGGVGIDTTFTVNGATGLKYRRIGT